MNIVSYLRLDPGCRAKQRSRNSPNQVDDQRYTMANTNCCLRVPVSFWGFFSVLLCSSEGVITVSKCLVDEYFCVQRAESACVAV